MWTTMEMNCRPRPCSKSPGVLGRGLRANMPWWGGFDPKAWTWASVLDAAGPTVAAALVYAAALEAVF